MTKTSTHKPVVAKTPAQLQCEANKLLAQNGFSYDGRSFKSISKSQGYFEKLIITTPMGNRMR